MNYTGKEISYAYEIQKYDRTMINKLAEVGAVCYYKLKALQKNRHAAWDTGNEDGLPADTALQYHLKRMIGFKLLQVVFIDSLRKHQVYIGTMKRNINCTTLSTGNIVSWNTCSLTIQKVSCCRKSIGIKDHKMRSIEAKILTLTLHYTARLAPRNDRSAQTYEQVNSKAWYPAIALLAVVVITKLI